MQHGDTDPGARTRARIAAIIEMTTETRRALGDVRFTAKSDGDLVEAEVDHRGALVALRIDPKAPTRARAGDLGAQVVQAVSRATREAEATGEEFLLARAAAAGFPVPPR